MLVTTFYRISLIQLNYSEAWRGEIGEKVRCGDRVSASDWLCE